MLFYISFAPLSSAYIIIAVSPRSTGSSGRRFRAMTSSIPSSQQNASDSRAHDDDLI